MPTTWYAVNSSANINAANQWNDAANGSGNFLTWANLGASDILIANGKTAIAINVNVTCAKVSNKTDGIGANAGAYTVAGAVTITANVEAGGATCITSSGNSYTWAIVGSIIGGTATSSYGVLISGNHTLNVSGTGATVTGGSASACYGIRHNNVGTINVTAAVVGGSAATCYGINNSSTGTVNIAGNVSGGSHASAYGLNNTSTGVCSVTGTIEGGTVAGAVAIFCAGTGVITITGVWLKTAGKNDAVGGLLAIYYTPTASQYIRVPSGSGTTVDYPAQLAAGNIKAGVVSGTVTGTYAATGGAVRIGRRL